MTTTTKDPDLKDAPKPEKETEKEDNDKEAFERSQKPPAEGPCKRCGNDRPLNRLFLCYPCWVKTNLEKDGWREGQPHPPHCQCVGECTLESKGDQN